MKAIILVVLPLLVLAPVISGDLCAIGAEEIQGNWFCQPVEGIQYSNVGHAGTYNEVIHMGADGSCDSRVKRFEGPIAPLDGEVSLHFRGPLHLKQLAVYELAPGSHSKRDMRSHRAHKEFHGRGDKSKLAHAHKHEERQVISATINGQVVSWQNNWFGPPATPIPTPVMVTATIDGQVVSWINNWFGESQFAGTKPTDAVPVAQPPVKQPAVDTAPAPQSTSQQATSNAPTLESFGMPPDGPGFDHGHEFKRVGYYNAASQHSEGLAFLGNHGGQGSGVFDHHFGASLSYTNCFATGGASSPQLLADAVIPSDAEVIVMKSEKCDNDCGYVRPGSIAHHGFSGADKVFFIEFLMPADGAKGFEADMPAIWLLNAEIPRTVQYGDPKCNCWTSGCGEFDILEALNTGSDKLKSTLHTNTPAGDSDYFVRPFSSSMKLAVVFSSANGGTIHIHKLAEDVEFAPSLAGVEVNDMCAEKEKVVSHFMVTPA